MATIDKNKKFSKRTIILLAVFSVLLVGGGYYAYTVLFAAGDTEDLLLSDGAIVAEQRVVVPEFEGDLLTNKQFLQFQKKTPSQFSEQLDVTVRPADAVTAPGVITVHNSGYGDALFVSWTAPATAADAYIVYRSQNANGGYAPRAMVTGEETGYVDTAVQPGNTYYYTVRSVRSEEMNRVSGVTSASSPQTGIQVSANQDEAARISVDDSPEIDARVVLRLRDGQEKLVAVMTEGQRTAYDTGGQTSDSYTVIFYSMFSMSQAAASASQTVTDTVLPDPPTDIRVAVDEAGESVLITWRNPDSPDFSYIRIYRSTAKGSLGTLINPESYNFIGLYDRENDYYYYQDTNVEQNVVYYYTVTSVDKAGNQSSTDLLTVPYRANPFEPIVF